MIQAEIFNLYRKVQNKDKEAIRKLVAEHRNKFPNHFFREYDDNPGLSNNYQRDLHTMYLHLTTGKK